MTLATITTWLWAKSTWVTLIQLVNIILASYNTVRTYDLNLKRQQRDDYLRQLGANGTLMNSTQNENFMLETHYLATQTLAAALQGITAWHYFYQDEPYFGNSTTIEGREVPSEEEAGGLLGQLRAIFNSNTKKYISIVEKTVRGGLELFKAFSEIGSMSE